MERVILFDGECNFCNRSVQFIIKRDPKARFKFASLQSEVGEQLLDEYNAPKHIDSLVLIENNRIFYKSTAALGVCKNLKGIWKLLHVLIVIPRPIRDLVYDIFAKNRYRLFGQRKSCMLPSPKERVRFL